MKTSSSSLIHLPNFQFTRLQNCDNLGQDVGSWAFSGKQRRVLCCGVYVFSSQTLFGGLVLFSAALLFTTLTSKKLLPTITAQYSTEEYIRCYQQKKRLPFAYGVIEQCLRMQPCVMRVCVMETIFLYFDSYLSNV